MAREDVKTESFTFQLSHEDTVIEINPPNYQQCYICIGNVDVTIHPFSLPFNAPSNLKCKFKVVYNTPHKIIPGEPFLPYLHVKDVSGTCYKIAPRQLVTQNSEDRLPVIQPTLDVYRENRNGDNTVDVTQNCCRCF